MLTKKIVLYSVGKSCDDGKYGICMMPSKKGTQKNKKGRKHNEIYTYRVTKTRSAWNR
jgi:hypothetical protein